MKDNVTLDDIAMESGKSMDGTIVMSVDDVMKKGGYSFAYDDGGPMPGQSVEYSTGITDNVEEEKTKAEQALLVKAAKLKYQKEQEEFNKKSDDEKVRSYVISTLLNDQEKQFVEKHGCRMSGQQRRYTRKRLEARYDKGKLITRKDKENILYQLNLPSSEEQKVNNPTTVQPGTAQNVRSLMGGGI